MWGKRRDARHRRSSFFAKNTEARYWRTIMHESRVWCICVCTEQREWCYVIIIVAKLDSANSNKEKERNSAKRFSSNRQNIQTHVLVTACCILMSRSATSRRRRKPLLVFLMKLKHFYDELLDIFGWSPIQMPWFVFKLLESHQWKEILQTLYFHLER